MSQKAASDSDLSQLGGGSDSFWEVGNYKRVVKRIDDGAKLCDEMIQMASERADIEAKYAAKLMRWKKKWEETIEKGPEYGSMESAWKGATNEAERLAEIHSQMKEELLSQVAASFQHWKSEQYHKHFFNFKETKAAEDGFEKAQRPWAKRLAKVDKYRKLYHQHAKQAEQALKQANEAERDAAVSPEQCKKLKDRAEKARNVQCNTKARYCEKLRDIDSYNPTYVHDMEMEFTKCQQFERVRLDFFKTTILMYKRILDLSASSQFGNVYQDFQGVIDRTSSVEDLEWYSASKGAKMPMNWPKFEEFMGSGEEAQQGGGGDSQLAVARTDTSKYSPGTMRGGGGAEKPKISAPVNAGPPYGGQDESDDEFVEPPPVPVDFSDRSAGGVGGVAEECPVRALYDYDGQENDELSFNAGDVLTKLEDEDEQGWCKGRFNGKRALPEEMSRSPFESKRTRKRSRRLIADFVSPDDCDFEPYIQQPRTPKSSPSVRRSARSIAQKHALASPSKSVAAVGRKLRNILSLPKAYLWCCYEWFYSDIDQSIFGGEGDFRLYLKEAFPTLQTRKLTRCQWAQIRRLMGKPRRCSALFFEEERHALEKQRAKIRLLQRREVSEMDWNHFKDIPQEIPSPLILGTAVTAWLHSKKHARLYTGRIEAVDLAKGQYHINFLQPGIGSCWVADIDVMSCTLQELLPISSFFQHPRRGLSWSSNISSLPPPVRISTPVASQSAFLKSDPIVGAVSLGSGNGGDTLGGFPIRFLQLVVQLSKILSIKKNNIERMNELNTQAEKLSSFDESIPPELQGRCASIVLLLEKLNRDLKISLQDIDEFMRQFDTKENGTGNGEQAGLSVRESSEHEAKELTSTLNEKENGGALVARENLVDLVSGLTSILFQFRRLGENEAMASSDLEALEDSIRHVKIDPANSTLFENQVEVHLSHIQTGLTRLGNLSAFSKVV